MTDLWEKCTRLMLLWTEVELDSFLSIILKITSNITSHPEDTKYQKLKFSNRLVSEKINARTGGQDFMLAMGFDVMEEELGDEVVCVYVLRADGLSNITSSVDWLSETTGVCTGLIQRKKAASSPPSSSSALYAAACLLQIKLPHNVCVQGGFMGSDSIGDVRSFVQHYFQEDRHDHVMIRLPHEPAPPSPLATLSELQLLPRAVLMASTMSAEDRDAAFKQAHVQAVVHEEEKVKYKQKSRQDKKQEHEQRQQHKNDILRAFREDHGGKDAYGGGG